MNRQAARSVVAVILALLCAGIARAEESDLARVEALDRQVVELYRERRYDDAVALAREALTLREKALGPEHLDVAASLNTLGRLYDNQGRYAETEPLYRRSLAIRERALGPDHPDLARSLNNL